MKVCRQRGAFIAANRGGGLCRPDEARDIEWGQYSGRERPPKLIANLSRPLPAGSFTLRLSVSVMSADLVGRHASQTPPCHVADARQHSVVARVQSGVVTYVDEPAPARISAVIMNVKCPLFRTDSERSP